MNLRHCALLACSIGLAALAQRSSGPNQVSIATEGPYRFIRSNGWPDHEPGQFPRKGNPNTVAPQSYTFRVPMKPVAAAEPARLFGWWGVALNGVPFEPGTAETWNNDPQSGWRYEAATGFLNLGLDEHNAHVQPSGAYHYHALPVGLVERLGGEGKKMLHIGWAADGYPVYTSWATDAKGVLRPMKSSYRVKQGARPAQAGGPGGNYDGRFTQDFEYVPGSGDLDEHNGRTGVTPEFPEGTYYYCITPEFPFVPRSWHGTPDVSFAKRGPPPGGGPGRRGGPGGKGPPPYRGNPFMPDFP
ncbi:MAG: YHYH protein [Roseimicrobium sp.]